LLIVHLRMQKAAKYTQIRIPRSEFRNRRILSAAHPARRFARKDSTKTLSKNSAASSAPTHSPRSISKGRFPAEGGLFKRAWFKNIVTAPPPNLKWKRGYDLGISKKAGADYTASLRVAYHNGDLYIDGGYRARIEYPDQLRYIRDRILNERSTEHGIEQSANGFAVVQELRRDQNTQGRAFRAVKVEGDKLTRALPWLALAEEGRVNLVRGAWNAEFIEEACSFPSGTHDDQIDAVSLAVRMQQQQSGKFHTF